MRELENVIERTIVLADGEKIDYHDLPLTFDEAGRDDQAVAPGAMPLNERLDEIERRLTDVQDVMIALCEKVDSMESDRDREKLV